MRRRPCFSYLFCGKTSCYDRDRILCVLKLPDNRAKKPCISCRAVFVCVVGRCMSVGWVRFLPQKSEDRGGSSVFLFVIERTSLSAFCHHHSFHGRLVSRVLCVRRRRDHLSVTAVADSLSATSEDSDGQPRVSSLLTAVLLPIGFTLTGLVSEAPVGSYPAFSPLHFCRSFLLHFP